MNVLKLKGARAYNGITQEDLAQRLHISIKTMNKKENSNPCKFSVEEIKKIARECGLDLDEVNDIFFDNELPNGNDKKKRDHEVRSRSTDI